MVDSEMISKELAEIITQLDTQGDDKQVTNVQIKQDGKK